MGWVWFGLVVALLVMLAVFAFVLGRKVIALLVAASDLIGTTAVLDGVHRAEPEQRPVPAVLAGTTAPSAAWRELRWRARERRVLRRRARHDRARDLLRAEVRSLPEF